MLMIPKRDGIYQRKVDAPLSMNACGHMLEVRLKCFGGGVVDMVTRNMDVNKYRIKQVHIPNDKVIMV